ncbi:MAG: SCP2 sterol-binding domain-containing protein [Gammaproteobacteria bacterium]|nr:SCP2 sterol-binding domain-containing protein [Gammaproteobacteria bacterium]NNF50599.1 sterol-binding protein [Woeseiaceae bacterium]MBT8093248.1 SCP2 sterol-binding domain-containing protein [Gammaproteobacteria bacterium]MBT8106054.1 SCP2 sterol-binding domain-containing protein [Gammaproteobacteria bacterium]NNK26068.1 sterol-binding protein [Woeseiaceae bacterium]
MSPLEAALRPLARVLNRNIRETTPARELCEKLDGAAIAVRVRNTGLVTWFVVHDEVLELVTDYDGEPDVVITGSLLTLARMGFASGLEDLRDGSLELTGDAHTAERLQRLLALAKPDVEEELSGVVGDAAAHRVGSVARGVGQWARDTRATMGANIREYLQEESRGAPSRYEVERFGAEVGTLRDDVERLAARIDRLQERD